MIEGGYGIYAYSSSGVLDVQNDGTITGDSNYGIYIANMVGANINNSGLIYGLSTGIDINGATEIAITNSGTISSNAHAIYAGSVDDFSLINSGTISSTGTDDLYYGVILDNVNLATIVNSGTISSSLAGQDRGLRLNEVDNTTIVNSGSILGGYFGLELNGQGSVTANVTNSGTISGGVFGIWSADTDLTLSNTGTISGGVSATNANLVDINNSGTMSGSTHGLYFAGLIEGTVANSGMISGGLTGVSIENSGSFSFVNSGTISGGINGLVTDNVTAASIVNSGKISAERYGIYIGGGSATITNSGTISGGTAAVRFSNDGNTLNILSGAVFDGGVDYNDTIDNVANFGAGSYSVAVSNYAKALNTVNLNNSRQTLVMDLTMANADIGSGQIQVVDVSSTSMDSAVRGYTNSIGNVLSSILSIDVGSSAGGSSEPASTGALGYAEEKKPTGAAAAVQKLGDDTAVDRYGNLFWVRAFGGQTFDNAKDTSSTNYGVAAGMDRQFDEGRFGVLAGYGRIINKADDGSGKTTGDTGFGGVYVRKDVGGVTLDASLIAGVIDNDSRREIFGSDPAQGSFTGWYVSPEIAISQKHEFAPGWVFTPSAKLRYTAGFYDGYTETGSTQNISYESRNSNTLEGILEGKITNRNDLVNGMKANVSFSAALVDTLSLGSSDMNASLSGTDFTVSAIGNRNLIGGRFGLSGDVQLNQQTTVYSGLTLGTYSSDIGSWSANAGVKVKF